MKIRTLTKDLLQMKYNIIILFTIGIFAGIFFFPSILHNSVKKEKIMENNNSDSLNDREPAVAGKFYPGNKEELNTMLDTLFGKAEKKVSYSIAKDDEILAIVSPHAGYIFSGIVAASAYLPLKERQDIKRVFLIGSSHHAFFDAASVYCGNSFITPLGKIKVDKKIALELTKNNKVFQSRSDVHAPEHSLEVQLPFLQHIWGTDFQIVPILLGTQSPQTCKEIAKVLKPYFVPGNLFVVSTDLSHYPEYNDALKVDQSTISAVCKNNPDKFLAQLDENEKKGILNLATSMCGWTSVLTLLYITNGDQNIQYVPILYQNSGETPIYGEKSKVVGYQSIAIIKKKPDDNNGLHIVFSNEEKVKLISIARQSIVDYIGSAKLQTFDESQLPKVFLEKYGAFVSLYIKGELRGCIGRMQSDQALYKTIQEMAVAAAIHDSRFDPVSADEISKIDIEISVLSPLKKIASIDEIVPGKHGILIKKGIRSGTYLPQVALKTGWNTEELLSHCAYEKAGIGWDGWKDAEIFIYEAIVFSDKD
jgi:MEMO1 family protein